MPRLTHLAGLELGTGVHVNIVAPERVARRAAAIARDRGMGAVLAARRRPLTFCLFFVVATAAGVGAERRWESAPGS